MRQYIQEKGLMPSCLHKTIVAVVAAFAVLLALPSYNATAFEHFISRDGSTLLDGKKPYRFVSVNIPNYFILEDRAGKHGKKCHRVTEFNHRDAARAVKRMGGQVFRSYTFAVDGGKNLADKLAHIYADERGRIRYNEELFRDVDRGKLLLWIFPMRFHSGMTARLLLIYPFSVISLDPDYGLTGL